MDQQFWDQFVGSGSANAVTMCVVAVLWGIKKLCTRDSRCNSRFHSCCCEINMRDVTRRSQKGNTDEGSGSPV